MSNPHALSPEALEERLEEHVDSVLSSRRTAAGPARRIAGYDRETQEFVLHWVAAVAGSNAEMAFQFASHVAAALECMDRSGVEVWLIRAMDAYDTAGLRAGVRVLEDVAAFAAERQERASGLSFEEVAGVLERFICGLSGRALKLEAAEQVYTDTNVVYLPPAVSMFAERDDNFRLYKATAAHLWGQAWYGTWRVDVEQALAGYPDFARALQVFHALETLRIDARIARDLPGLGREMVGLRETLGQAGLPPHWRELRLGAAGATVADTLRLLPAAYAGPLSAPCCYQGELQPQRVRAAMAARLERERLALRKLVGELVRDRSRPEGEGQPGSPRVTARRVERPEHPDGDTFELHLDGKPMAPPEAAESLLRSILQDLGDIPPEYLVPAGGGGYGAAEELEASRRARDVWKGTYHEEGAYLYNEWDHQRQHYRKNWCVLRELDVHPHGGDFVSRALRHHAGLVKSIRRTFEALRGEDRWLRKQPEGDEIDIDALVETYADSHAGMEVSERVFSKLQKHERSIAVMFMVDMSGSTKGWINDAEREALLLLGEALETLGDRYAIYGFSGMTRKRCELYRVKRFDEPYGDLVKGRIGGIAPQDYTRMGVAIRHLCRVLNQQEAKIRLLITLSDGKPDDYDGYRGRYGIEDTRQALVEARRDGIHPFCITIDKEAREYLPHMYGAVSYTVIDEVRKLPLKVSDIYRRLTS